MADPYLLLGCGHQVLADRVRHLCPQQTRPDHLAIFGHAHPRGVLQVLLQCAQPLLVQRIGQDRGRLRCGRLLRGFRTLGRRGGGRFALGAVFSCGRRCGDRGRGEKLCGGGRFDGGLCRPGGLRHRQRALAARHLFAQRIGHLFVADGNAHVGRLDAQDSAFDHFVEDLRPQRQRTGQRGVDRSDLGGEQAGVAKLLGEDLQPRALIFQFALAQAGLFPELARDDRFAFDLRQHAVGLDDRLADHAINDQQQGGTDDAAHNRHEPQIAFPVARTQPGLTPILNLRLRFLLSSSALLGHRSPSCVCL